MVQLEQMPMGSQASQTHYRHFKMHNNPVKLFVQTFCELAPEHRMPSADYAKAISIWARNQDISFSINVNHTQILREEHIEIKAENVRCFGKKCRALVGIRLNKAGEKLLENDFAHDW